MSAKHNSKLPTMAIQVRPPGRPTKRTDQTLNILFEAAATGAPIKACCAAAGISTDTFNDWREKDPELQMKFDEARECGRVAALYLLQQAGQHDWRAAAEWLRLSFRAEYSHKAELQIETKQRDTLQDLLMKIRAGKDEMTAAEEVNVKVTIGGSVG